MNFTGSMRRRLAAFGLAAAGLCGTAGAGEIQGFRFQIVTGDDSSVTRRITDDLYKRLVPVFGGFWDPLESTCRHASLSIL